MGLGPPGDAGSWVLGSGPKTRATGQSAYPLGTICIIFKAENEIERDKRKKAAKWWGTADLWC